MTLTDLSVGARLGTPPLFANRRRLHVIAKKGVADRSIPFTCRLVTTLLGIEPQKKSFISFQRDPIFNKPLFNRCLQKTSTA